MLTESQWRGQNEKILRLKRQILKTDLETIREGIYIFNSRYTIQQQILRQIIPEVDSEAQHFSYIPKADIRST